jgi:hypothetical protein
MDFVTQNGLSTQLIDAMSFVKKWFENIVANKQVIFDFFRFLSGQNWQRY